MKKLLLILLFLPMIVLGQDDNNTEIQNQVDNINYRLDQHSKQYYTGITLSITGLGVSVIGALIPLNPLIYIGGALGLSGTIVNIDSHKWFKSSKKKKNFNEKNINDENLLKLELRKRQLKKLLLSGLITQEEYDAEGKKLELLKQ
jgi:hypothetical protein